MTTGSGCRPDCSVNNGGCPANSACSAHEVGGDGVMGVTQCTCDAGYVGFIDAFRRIDRVSYCRFAEAGYDCTGFTCQDVDECAGGELAATAVLQFSAFSDTSQLSTPLTTTSPCPQNSVCVNTPGSFTCTCAAGYEAAEYAATSARAVTDTANDARACKGVYGGRTGACGNTGFQPQACPYYWGMEDRGGVYVAFTADQNPYDASASGDAVSGKNLWPDGSAAYCIGW